jgi:hypothetical protein
MCRRAFNLVEVILAILVAGIGLITILGMFPVGLNATKSANLQNYVSDFADQLAGTFGTYLQADWDSFVDTANGTESLPVYTGGTYNLSQLDDSRDDAEDWVDTDPSGNPGVLYEHAGVIPKYGLYKIVQSTDGTADLIVGARVWQEPVTNAIMQSDGSSTTVTLDDALAVAVNIELSWPHHAPYANRKKEVFRLEVFNPNP